MIRDHSSIVRLLPAFAVVVLTMLPWPYAGERSEARPASVAGRTLVLPSRGELKVRDTDGLRAESKVVARVVSRSRFARLKKLSNPAAVEGKLPYRRSTFDAGRSRFVVEGGELATPSGAVAVERGQIVVKTNRDGIKSHRMRVRGELESGGNVSIVLRSSGRGVIR